MSLREIPHPGENFIISCLPQEERDSVVSHAEALTVSQGLMLAEAGKVPERVYFLSGGLASVIAVSPSGKRAEVGIVGYEGVTPVNAVHDMAPGHFDVVMQIAGHGLRLPATVFSELVAERPALRTLLHRYEHSLGMQAMFTALSNAVHNANERLARWLLMCHDRVRGDELHLTHEFLAVMLAVRRATVTDSLHVLEGHKLVRATRGVIVIRDRAALEDFARDSYGAPEREFAMHHPATREAVGTPADRNIA